MNNTVNLCDGRQVSSASEEWRQECLAVHTHVQNLRGRSLAQRREYMRALEHRAGPELARRVADAYAKDWEARKAAQATPQPTTTTESNP